MADNKKGTIIAVSVISLLLVGTAIFFVVKGAKLKPRPQGGGRPDGDDGRGGTGGQVPVSNQTTTTTEQPQTQSGSGIGNFFENLRNTFAGGVTTKDPSTFEGFKFPIRRTQRGENVKRLQQLLLTFDKNILPKFGADGFFGTETEDALAKVIGKKQVESQADITAIETKIKQKAGGIMYGVALNQSLGIKLF